MGVSTNVYAIYGVRLEWDDELIDMMEEYYDKTDSYGVDSICDYMCGEYMVFGILLYNSGDARWGEMCNIESIDISNLADEREEYIRRFEKLYPSKLDLISVPWKLECFVHAS